MSESVANLSPAGAGRIQDLIFPSRLTAAGPNLLGTNHTGRTRTEDLQGTIAGIGGGHVNPAADVRLGVPSVHFVSDATTGLSFRFYPSMGFYFNTDVNSINPVGVANIVTRIIWAFCGSGIATATDFGLQVVRPAGAGSQRIIADTAPGWGFQLADANTLQFLARGNNGLITLNLTAAPFDLTAWHVIDMRITSASSVTDATLDVRLDGTPLNLGPLNSSWAAGTNLPPAAFVAGNIGFMPCLVCSPAPANSFWTYQLRFIQAPTTIATL